MKIPSNGRRVLPKLTLEERDLGWTSEEERYLYEERAGIIEFCGNVPRDIAEQEAWREIVQMRVN
jgi:hypothetical protein